MACPRSPIPPSTWMRGPIRRKSISHLGSSVSSASSLALTITIGFNAWDPIGGQTNIPGALYTVTLFGGQKTSSYAVFGEGTYQITDDLSLIGGVRYNDDDRSLIGMFYFDVPPGTNNLPTWETRNWGSVTQRVSLSYKVTPTTNAYFTYSTGFQSGNSRCNTKPPYRSTPPPLNARPKGRYKAGSCILAGLGAAGNDHRLRARCEVRAYVLAARGCLHL